MAPPKIEGSTISSNAAVGSFGDTLFDHNFHVQAGFVYNPQEDERIMVAGGDIIGWFVENNDTALNVGFMVVFAEL